MTWNPPHPPSLSSPLPTRLKPPKQSPARKITYINEFKLFLPCEIGCSCCCCYCFYCCYCCCSCACCCCCFSPVIYNVSSQRQKLHFHAQFTPIHKAKTKTINTQAHTHSHTLTYIHIHTHTSCRKSKACDWANQSRGMSDSQFVCMCLLFVCKKLV